MGFDVTHCYAIMPTGARLNSMVAKYMDKIKVIKPKDISAVHQCTTFIDANFRIGFSQFGRGYSAKGHLDLGTQTI